MTDETLGLLAVFFTGGLAFVIIGAILEWMGNHGW
jgi:hypothetical protein